VFSQCFVAQVAEFHTGDHTPGVSHESPETRGFGRLENGRISLSGSDTPAGRAKPHGDVRLMCIPHLEVCTYMQPHTHITPGSVISSITELGVSCFCGGFELEHLRPDSRRPQSSGSNTARDVCRDRQSVSCLHSQARDSPSS
jgi:hypothetical protein